MLAELGRWNIGGGTLAIETQRVGDLRHAIDLTGHPPVLHLGIGKHFRQGVNRPCRNAQGFEPRQPHVPFIAAEYALDQGHQVVTMGHPPFIGGVLALTPLGMPEQFSEACKLSIIAYRQHQVAIPTRQTPGREQYWGGRCHSALVHDH